MDGIKVSLSITLPGRVLLNNNDCLKTIYKKQSVKLKNGKTIERMTSYQVDDWDKTDTHTMQVSDQGKDKETITFYTRKCRTAMQSLKISDIAYKNMLSSCPETMQPSEWKKLSLKQKLEAHLKEIMEGLGGISYTYQILGD